MSTSITSPASDPPIPDVRRRGRNSSLRSSPPCTSARVLRAGAAAVVLATGFGLLSPAAPAQARAAYDTTSAVERRRVDAVLSPKLDWYPCFLGLIECETVKLPMDYDHPKGAQTEISLMRNPADDPKRKIGTLFVNPGGPGGSGTLFALDSARFLSQDVLDRFDIVGFDPRGTNFSDNVTCFPGEREQGRAYQGFDPLPLTAKARQSTFKAVRAIGRACSTTGKPLSASMSTAEVARDMDVLRRAVGDQKLSYLGFSYGTYLGQVYANLFPDRVRALALDGVVDPLGWRGSTATRNEPMWDRIRSADGATKALRTLLERCDQAGPGCTFSPGDPVANFDTIARRLKKSPLPVVDPLFGQERYGYADFVSEVLYYLYAADGAEAVERMLTDLLVATEPPALAGRAAARGETETARTAALKDLAALNRETAARRDSIAGPRAGFIYDNEFEAFNAVACTDSVNPRKLSRFPAAAAAADRRAKYFGAAWTWNGAACASDAWSAKDEDAYRGSFTRRTVNPLLFVGNTYDPATNYASAVKADRLAPNSALLSSNSWGHTAYGTSDCATGAVDAYLLTGRTPAPGKTCVGDYQPFVDSASDKTADPTVVQHLAARSLPGLHDLRR